MAKAPRQTPERLAEQAKPGWRAVVGVPITDRAGLLRADAQVPELERLRRKYFGATDAHGRLEQSPDNGTLVVLEPKTAVDDTPVGRKRVLVERENVTGEQG